MTLPLVSLKFPLSMGSLFHFLYISVLHPSDLLD